MSSFYYYNHYRTPFVPTTLFPPERSNLLTYNIIDGEVRNVQNDEVVSGGGGDTKPARVKSRKPAGWLFPKAYDRAIVKHGTVTGLIIQPTGNGLHFMNGNLSGQITSGAPSGNELPSSLRVDNDRNSVVTKALLNLKDQKINLGVAFAERAQTAELIGSAASRIGRAFSFASKGKFKRAAESLGVSTRKQQPNNWLELQYGWKPLLSDVYGATEALRTVDQLGWLASITASTNNSDESIVNLLEGTAFAHDRHLIGKWGHFIRLDYLPGNGFSRVLSYTGISNPLEIIWELVPYSFVVDWFLPVGNFLSALDAANGFDFKSGSITFRRRHTLSIRPGSTPGNVSASFSGTSSSFLMERSVLYSSPLPWAPVIKNPLSLGHMANGLSLLAGAFGRR